MVILTLVNVGCPLMQCFRYRYLSHGGGGRKTKRTLENRTDDKRQEGRSGGEEERKDRSGEWMKMEMAS